MVNKAHRNGGQGVLGHNMATCGHKQRKCGGEISGTWKGPVLMHRRQNSK
jgi:hypothetical protein